MAEVTIQQAFELALQRHQAGRLQEAEPIYRQILSQQPGHPGALHYLGVLAHQVGQNDMAAELMRRALAGKPEWPEAYYNLGSVLEAMGQVDNAIAAYRQALALRPHDAEANNNLGNALQAKGNIDEAIAAYQQALAVEPNYAEAHNNLGVALQAKGRLDEAVTSWREALKIKPNYPDAHNNLGNTLKDRGCLDEAIAAFRQALALAPGFPKAHSNLVLCLHYHPAFDAQAIAHECHRWNQQHAEPLKKFIQPHANDRDRERRLRIGYVSSDFRNHPVGRFILPLLAAHDHKQFEIFCYAQVPAPDQMTAKLQAHADTWRSIVGVSDEQTADMIRQDQIDILVDLALHTAGNRLLLFARKPAPVQVAYLGYAGRTGLDTIDYRLSDRYLDPNDDEDHYCTEKSFRLAGAYCCYQQSLAMPVSELPALSAGQITFGCLNNFNKVTPDTLETWAGLLQQVGNARLLLLSPEGSHRDRVRGLLQERGVAPERLELLARLSPEEYFQTYQRLDIALDPFPCTGGTTTCDALWMGVPVVSLKGKTAVGRAGLSILSNVGLPELVADTPEQYVRLAVELASNLPRLQQLRSTLRQRMETSPLMDAPTFARSIEAAYRQMWRTWCATVG